MKSSGPPASRYRPELDALRFFAFLLVFDRHMLLIQPRVVSELGAFGVQIFFVLSAYLIVSLLLREKETTGTISIGKFAMRRALRIWPLAFLAVAAGYVLGQISPPFHVSIRTAVAFAAFGGNIYILLHGWIYQPIGILWSLSAEEQFYLFLPWLARHGDVRWLKTACWAAIALSYAMLGYLGVRHTHPNPYVFVNPLVSAQFFAIGGLLAIHLRGRHWNRSGLFRLLLLAGGLLLFAFAARYGNLQEDLPGNAWTLLSGYSVLAAGCVAIFLAFFDYRGHIPAAFTYLGKISYGLYVFHTWFIHIAYPRRWDSSTSHAFRLAFDVVALALTIGTASLSYHFFEGPILRFKKRFETVRTTFASGSGAV